MIVLLTSAYPLTNGDISTNYLYPDKKGVEFPESYSEMNNALSKNTGPNHATNRNIHYI